MKLVLRVRENEWDDDPTDDAQERELYEPVPPAPLRLRCYACGGIGLLWIMDEHWPRGRQARCIACRGCGRVTIP